MPLASFLAGTIGKSILGGAMSAVASNLLKPKVQNPRIDFKQMRDDAAAAGFNPLTAMRSGAMSGYMIPALSKQSFVGQFLSGAIRAGTDAFLNKDIDAYNAELRKLNLIEKTQNIKLGKQQLKMDMPKEIGLFNQDGTAVTDKMGNQIKVDATYSEAIPKYRVVFDQGTGETYAVLNPELMEGGGPTEVAVALSMDQLAKGAAATGQGKTVKIFGTQVGISADPFGLNQANRTAIGSKMTLSFPMAFE
jgi:hypothetical protein